MKAGLWESCSMMMEMALCRIAESPKEINRTQLARIFIRRFETGITRFACATSRMTAPGNALGLQPCDTTQLPAHHPAERRDRCRT